MLKRIGKMDMVAAVGMNFKGDKDIFIQQAYIDARYKWLGIFAGSRWASTAGCAGRT